MISAIILAAGESLRFGSPKALAKFNNGMFVINYIISNLVKIDDVDVIVVLGAHADQIQPVILKHKTVRIVYNKDHNFGQTSSFQKGVSVASEKTSGFLLLPVDCPLIKSTTIIEMTKIFQELSPKLLIPVLNGKKGHPPIFNKTCKNDIVQLGVDAGLNSYQRQLTKSTHLFTTNDEGVLCTFNTQQEFDLVKKKSGLI